MKEKEHQNQYVRTYFKNIVANGIVVLYYFSNQVLNNVELS